MGDPGGLRDQREGVATLERLGFWYLLLVSAYNYSESLRILEGPRQAAGYIRQALETAAHRGLDVDELSAPLRETMYALGAWDELISNADNVIERAQARGARFDLAIARLHKARVALYRGDFEVGRELAAEAHDDALLLQLPEIIDSALVVKGILADLTHDEAELRQCVRAILANRPSHTEFPDVPSLVRLCIAADATSEAGSIVETMPAVTPLQTVEVSSARAFVTQAQGRAAEAAELFEGAAQLWADYPHVLEHAFALLGRARCLIAIGNAAEASSDLLAAHDTFSQLGAFPLQSETHALLEGHEARP